MIYSQLDNFFKDIFKCILENETLYRSIYYKDFKSGHFKNLTLTFKFLLYV